MSDFVEAVGACADGADYRDNGAAAPASQYPSRLLKLSISLGFWCFLAAGRILLRLIRRGPSGTATVVYYHQIAPGERQRFARQLDHLCKWVKPIAADSRYPLPRGSRCVAVTFDDGWKSFAEIAFPELEQRKIPVALFAIPGRLGCRLEAYTDEQLISAAELEQLAAKGVTIGSHTLTHCPLTIVDDARALYELRESRRVLGELLGQEATLFAFPFGLSDERTVALCREAGYRRVFTTQPYRAYSRSGEFETGRVRVDPSDWPLEFHLKIIGAYRWLPAAIAAKGRLRQAMHWLMGRTRYPAEVVPAPSILEGRGETTLQAKDQ
ncbi:MAG: polysaccharide deacetylase family protein, partial [Deltaproteobacteria bacterium]|nr:polysaccharide deacetylase family protein [Deltaproteobacteria bacterium]